MLALHAIRQAELHVVAQVVEAVFVVGAVGDIAAVVFVAFLIAQIVHDDAHRHAQAFVDAAHPLGIALRQVIVDGDHVDAFSRQGVEVHRQRRDQRLAFAGFHFGDFAAMQHDAADQLHVEVPHVDEAAAGFAHGGEGGNQKVVERGPLRQLLAEGDGLRGQLLIGQRLHLRLQLIDGRDQRHHRLHVARVFGAKYLGEEGLRPHIPDHQGKGDNNNAYNDKRYQHLLLSFSLIVNLLSGAGPLGRKRGSAAQLGAVVLPGEEAKSCRGGWGPGRRQVCHDKRRENSEPHARSVALAT